MKPRTPSVMVKNRILKLLDRAIYPLVTVVLLILLLIQINATLQVQQKHDEERTRVEELKAKLDTYKESSHISETDRVLYGSILARQFPAADNLFTSLDMTDSFTSVTGLDISQTQSAAAQAAGVSAQASTTSSDFTATGSMTASQLDEFLTYYAFEFPRFLTMQSASLKRSIERPNEWNVLFTFKGYTTPEVVIPSADKTKPYAQFIPSDIQAFETYKQKANVGLYIAPQNEQPVDDTYEVAPSPF